jgi:hypothetical protein
LIKGCKERENILKAESCVARLKVNNFSKNVRQTKGILCDSFNGLEFLMKKAGTESQDESQDESQYESQDDGQDEGQEERKEVK